MRALLLMLALAVAPLTAAFAGEIPALRAVAPAPPARPTPQELAVEASLLRTDTTFAVRPGARLELSNFGGEINVHGWEKSAVRLEAEHSSRSKVAIENAGVVWTVKAYSRMGVPRALNYDLSVPSWLALALSGVYTDVSVEGVNGDLNIDTVRGDVSLSGGLGNVTLTTVEGDVCLRGSKGRLALSAVNNDIRVEDAGGPINAETVNGDIRLVGIAADSVEATSVNGQVSFAGAIRAAGAYRFSTHNGDIVVAVPEDIGARVEVATYNGSFESSFPVRLDALKRGKRFSFALGAGGGLLDLESFQGAIRLCRPSEHCADDDGAPCAKATSREIRVKVLEKKNHDKERDKEEEK